MNEQETRGHRISFAACAMVIATSMGAGAMPSSSAGQPGQSSQPVEMIERYCETSWRNAQIARQDWGDCTQEAFVRLLERVPQERLKRAISDSASSERRELNRSIWATAQKWRRAVRRRPARQLAHETADLADQASANVNGADEIEDLREEARRAMTKLSDRQQEILTRVSRGDSIAEIADALHLTPARVSDEKYKAIQKMRRA